MKLFSTFFIFILSVIVSSFASLVSKAAKTCDPVQLSKGIACRCSATYCDEIEEHPAINPNEIFIYTSNEAGKRLELEKVTVPPSASVTTPSGAITVELDGKAHQKMLGFGGAFTDSAAYVLSLLPGQAQKNLISSYFSRKTGAKYSMGRVPVGSSDFSRKQYSLIQANNDFNTADFALQDDNLVRGVDYKLDLILRAQQEILQTSVNDTSVPFGINPSQLSKALSIFGSIWTAPVWMKTCAQPPAPGGINSCGTGFIASLYGRPKVPTFEFGGLNTTAAVRNAYARYLLKFLKAYAARGVELWGITTQNEPAGNPTGNKWENTNYKPNDLANFVNNQLGPVLKAEFPNIKIMIGDDNYPELPEHASNANTSPYIDGVAYHWYYSMAGSLINTGQFGFEFFGGQKTIGEAYDKYTMTNKNGRKFLLMTEACTGYIDNVIEGGSWERGYNYLTSILHEVERGAAGWVDWNMALDMSGGPNHAGNVVDSPILVDTAQGVFYKNPMYYTMSHFSAFVPPGAIRLGIANTDIGFIGSSKALEVIAFRRSETSTECVLIIANDHLTASLPTRGLSSAHTVLFKLPYNGNKIVIPMNDNEFKTVLFHCPLSATANNKEESEGEEAQSGLLGAFGGSKAAVAGVGAGVALVASMLVIVSVMLWRRPKSTKKTTSVSGEAASKDVEMVEERKPSL